VVFEEREALAHRLAYGLLLVGEVRQNVNEDVSDGDAPGDREPDAAGGDVEEAQPAGEKVYEGQTDSQESREENE
jgi:hypothetical protein